MSSAAFLPEVNKPEARFQPFCPRPILVQHGPACEREGENIKRTSSVFPFFLLLLLFIQK